MAQPEVYPDGMREIHQLVEQINTSNAQLAGVEYPGLPWPAGKSSAEIIATSNQLVPMLRDNLEEGGWDEAEIGQLLSEAGSLQENYAQKGKGKRHSGEDTIYHSLRIATHLTFLGITDRDIIRAAIWHDAKEDLPDFWQKNEDLLPKAVRELVDAATKKDGNAAKESLEQQLINDELATVIHLCEAAQLDRSLLLKEGDVMDNAPTFDSMPVNDSKQRMKRDRKVQRFLWVFYPLLKKTHGAVIANQIAETSLRLQFPEKYAQIQRQMAAEQEEFSQITNQENEFSLYKDTLIGIENNAFQPNTSRLPSEDMPNNVEPDADGFYYDPIHPDYLTPPVTQILGRDIVSIYRGDYHPDLRFPTLPYLKIICRSEKERAYWLNYLRAGNKNTNLIEDEEGSIHLTIPLATKSQTGISLNAEVVLSTVEDEILPLDLYRTKQNDPRANAIREIAVDKFKAIEDAYKSAVERGDPKPVLSEHFTKNSVAFFTPDNDRFIVPERATYLDALSAIGKNLPLDAVAIYVLENGRKKPVSMGEVIESGLQIEAVTYKMIADNPSLYQELLASAKGKPALKAEIKEMMAGNIPAKIDMATTDRAIGLLENKLFLLSEDESMLKAARSRARKMIARLYRLIQPQKLRFDQFIKDGFTGELEAKYGSLDHLLERIGQIPIPLREEFIDHFEKPELTFKIDKKGATIEALTDLNRLVNNLIDFRSKLPTVNINGIPNKGGVLKTLGELLERYGFDVLPMRARAVYESNDGINRADIELVLRVSDKASRDRFLKDARELFPDSEISIIDPQENVIFEEE